MKSSKPSVLLRLLPSLLLTAAAVPATAAQAGTPDLTAQIDEIVLVEKKVSPTGPGYAIAVMRDGQVVFAKGYGLANLKDQTPVTPATAFNVGSMSKQFTAACILLLVHDGRLSLDDEIHRYLPELPAYGHPVTIRQLVHHTSGIPSDDGLIALSGRRFTDRLSNRDAVKMIARSHTLNFVPGSEHSYSNSGYILLGEIVARVSGQSLGDFAAERIFKPLGMSRTVLNDDPARRIENEAVGYARTGEATWTPSGERVNTELGANNVYSTVEDLARWDRNFRDQTVGGPRFTEEMQTRGVLNGGEVLSYAFGLEVQRDGGALSVSHGGATPGFRSHMMRLPEQRWSAVCLTNDDHGAPVSTLKKIARLMLGDVFARPPAGAAATAPAPPAAARVDLEPAALARYVGKYQFDDGYVATITQEGGTLNGQLTGQPPFTLVAEAAASFHIEEAPEIKFSFDGVEGGKATRATLDQGGVRRMVRIADAALSPSELAAFVGDYHSDELDVTYTVVRVEDQLFLRSPVVDPVYREDKGITGNDLLVYDGGDTFALGTMPVVCRIPVAFRRDAQGRPSGFTLDAGRIRNLLFVRK